MIASKVCYALAELIQHNDAYSYSGNGLITSIPDDNAGILTTDPIINKRVKPKVCWER